ncbi:hypothetical protein, partial [Mycolicibacterium sp. CR10]|uniref:hypothetical protein n=1 Tax=Mycolicibacterium sp. CR10 TaxID=2562314 RepID=UPI00197B0F67
GWRRLPRLRFPVVLPRFPSGWRRLPHLRFPVVLPRFPSGWRRRPHLRFPVRRSSVKQAQSRLLVCLHPVPQFRRQQVTRPPVAPDFREHRSRVHLQLCLLAGFLLLVPRLWARPVWRRPRRRVLPVFRSVGRVVW